MVCKGNLNNSAKQRSQRSINRYRHRSNLNLELKLKPKLKHKYSSGPKHKPRHSCYRRDSSKRANPYTRNNLELSRFKLSSKVDKSNNSLGSVNLPKTVPRLIIVTSTSPYSKKP